MKFTNLNKIKTKNEQIHFHIRYKRVRRRLEIKMKGIAMKKLLILAGVIGLMTTTQAFAEETAAPADRPQGPCPMRECGRPDFGGEFHKIKKHPDFKKFEETLNLTEEQKAKAKEIRENTREQMKPILDKIAEKYREQKAIMDKKLTAEERQKELAPIRKEIRELRGEMHKIRKQGKEDFEAILTSKQVKQLNKMKENARKEFKKKFPHGRHGDWDRIRPLGPKCGCPKPPIELPVEPPIEPVEE